MGDDLHHSTQRSSPHAHPGLVTLLACLVAVNVVVLCFLGFIAYEYGRGNGLGDTFYEIERDFQLVKSTMNNVRAPRPMTSSHDIIAWHRSTPPPRHCRSCSAWPVRTLRQIYTMFASMGAPVYALTTLLQLCKFTHFGDGHLCGYWNGTLQNGTVY